MYIILFKGGDKMKAKPHTVRGFLATSMTELAQSIDLVVKEPNPNDIDIQHNFFNNKYTALVPFRYQP